MLALAFFFIRPATNTKKLVLLKKEKLERI